VTIAAQQPRLFTELFTFLLQQVRSLDDLCVFLAQFFGHGKQLEPFVVQGCTNGKRRRDVHRTHNIHKPRSRQNGATVQVVSTNLRLQLGTDLSCIPI